MKISKELIQKYHKGQCTPDEEKAVEVWLFDDENVSEATWQLPDDARKAELQEQMWDDIAAVLPSSKKIGIVASFRPIWRQAAAIFLISLMGATAFLMRNQEESTGVVMVNNVSETANKNVQESAYSISVGPKSNVAIHNESGRIDFCGTMMIHPKRDIELTIQGTCARPDEKQEKILLKKGQPYIALNYGHNTTGNEVLILSPGSLTGLPPLVQRQLMMQFNI